jgi:ArsR family transcriptional regulator
MIEILKALAEENRLRIISLLIENEMCVCKIESCLNMTQSNASRHLTILKQSGILQSFKQAQWTNYRINDRLPTIQSTGSRRQPALNKNSNEENVLGNTR